MLNDLNEAVNDADIDAALHLFFGSCSDVGKNPASFFSEGLFLVGQDTVQSLDEASVDGELSLRVVSCDYVSDGSEAWDSDGNVLVAEESDHLLEQSEVRQVVNSLLLAITQVTECPTDVIDDQIIVVLDQNLDQSRNCSSDLLVLGLWSSSAQVGEGP